MKKIFIVFFVICINVFLFSSQNNSWIRYSEISPDGNSIVFTYKGDLYLVSTKGGEAKPLTFHKAHDYSAVWSPDSKKIAFASDRFGNFDVFLIDVKGGEPLRLTYHSNNEIPYSFSNDGKNVIFGGARLDSVNHRQFPTNYLTEVYSVSVKGGRINQVWTIPAELVKVRKDGKEMIYQDKKGSENYWRKHHTSSVTRDIWKYDVVKDKHIKVTDFNGEDRNPVYSNNGKHIYYLSEESKTFNIHSLDLNNPKNKRQITFFKLHPVRFLSISDNGKLCFTHNGELYTKEAGKEAEKINIKINTERKENNRKVVSVRGNVSEMAISPDGKEIAYIVRGEVFVTSVKGSMTKRITDTASQESFVSFTPDGKGIVYASERNSKWGIYKTIRVNNKEPHFYASTVLKEEELVVNQKDNYQPEFSPDGKELAYIENRKVLRILNIKNGKTRTLLDGKVLYYMGDGDQYFQWSPDSKWLLVQYIPVMGNAEVVLLKADNSKKMMNLTESGYDDIMPKWVNGGKQMIWFSNRHGLRSYANSGSKQWDVYSMFFTKEAWDKFNMSKDDYALWKEMNKKNKKKDDKKKKKDKADKKKIKSLKFDWDGMSDRKKRLTIHSSYLSDAVLSKDGENLYYLASFEKGINLWTTKLRTGDTKILIRLSGRDGSLKWDRNMKNLYLLSGGRISKIEVSKKSKKPIGIRGEIVFDETAERHEMFNHVWKRTKSMFYISSFHGADWDVLRKNYEPKLSSIGDDFEFTELLSEMLGELNVSHCGARYRNYNSKGDRTASLGIFIDYEYKGQGIKIAEVIKDGPLDKFNVRVKKGEVITEINGVKIGDSDYARYLNKLAGKFTALRVYNPKIKLYKNITVKPVSLGRERGLLYKRWVRINEREVDRLSNGRLGYVHIPGMSDGSYRLTYEKAMGKYFNRDGLIVDTRFNGGGDLVGDITMFLTGERFITYAIEDRELGLEPNYRWLKPSVAMANEANYSDGHCFACAYKELGIGKLIGMPVPGTCSYAGWEMLQNGKILWGSIPVSAKNKAGEWMENNQTVPDVIVKNLPGVIDRGRDQQLETAVKELLKITKK